jgi:hypothetical protein
VQVTCFSLCPTGTYYANQYCATCTIPNCVACASATVCVLCTAGLVPNVTDYASCIAQNTTTPTNQTNSSCPFDCLTCDSNQNCLTCSASDFRTLSQGRCVPLPGYYENNQTVAGACSTGCANCTSASSCDSCSSGYQLQSGQCVSNQTQGCPPRTFDFNGECSACPPDCYTCNDQQVCLSCNATTDFRELSGYRCVPIAGYYESGVTVAAQCPTGCSACYAPSYCTACSPGYYLAGNAQCYIPQPGSSSLSVNDP